nr:hypothetical protein [Tanacetum cinerariifolium]
DYRSARKSENRSRDAGNAGYKGRDNGKRTVKEEDENALLDEALREKEDLKPKLENFETSSKILAKMLDSQINAKVKTGLGYDNQFHEKEVLAIREEEVTETVFDNRSGDEDNSLANDSISHRIKVYTFDGDRLAKKSVLPTDVGKGTGHRERRPVWK